MLPTCSNSLTSSPTATIVGQSDQQNSDQQTCVYEREIDLKVLHIVNGEHFSGAERVQSHLGRCLPEFGVRADFAMVKPGQFAKKIHEQNGDWGSGFQTAMTGRFDLRPVKTVARLVREGSYGLLHAHTPRTAMVAALASKIARVPWVYHVHSPASRDSTRRFVNTINAVIEKQSLKRCAHLITVSNSLRDDCLTHGVDSHRITVVRNGVPAICPPRRIPKPHQRAGDTDWIIGVIALHRPRKGLESAIDAMAHVLASGLRVRLRVIGPFENDSYRQSIKEHIVRRGLESSIEWKGFTDSVPEELASMDAMMLPSLFGEGLPMVVLESMAAGTPVIATRVEGTPEAVTDGVEGLLAEPNDPHSLAGQIESLVRGHVDWQQMSDNAKQRHAEEFSDFAMACATAEVYRKVIG